MISPLLFREKTRGLAIGNSQTNSVKLLELFAATCRTRNATSSNSCATIPARPQKQRNVLYGTQIRDNAPLPGCFEESQVDLPPMRLPSPRFENCHIDTLINDRNLSWVQMFRLDGNALRFLRIRHHAGRAEIGDCEKRSAKRACTSTLCSTGLLSQCERRLATPERRTSRFYSCRRARSECDDDRDIAGSRAA